MDSSMKLHLSSRLSIVEQLDEHYQVVRCKMHNISTFCLESGGNNEENRLPTGWPGTLSCRQLQVTNK